MDRYDMLPNIVQHSLVVCRVAVTVAYALNTVEKRYNLAAIEAAALLHDITKTRSLTTGENHATTGARLLCDIGYPSIAPMVLEHIYPTDRGLEITQEEIVGYADKRVLHADVVTLDNRFSYLYDRYGKGAFAVERISKARQRARDIENKIQGMLQQNPLLSDTLLTENL